MMLFKKDNSPLFPRNRKEVFSDLLKHHKFELIKANLWFLLFSFFSIGTLFIYFLYSRMAQLSFLDGTLSLPTKGNGEALTIDEYLLAVRTIVFFVLTFTNILFALGLGGLQRVIQNLVFAEPIEKVRYIFFEGVKKNAKQYIELSILFSIVINFSQFIVSYYWFYSEDFMVIVTTAIGAILVLLVLLLLPFGFACSNLYSCSFISLIKNTYALYFTRWYKNIGISILVDIPVLMFLIPSTYFISIWAIIMCFIYMPIRQIIHTLLFNEVADEKINKEIFPEIYRKGISNN